MYIRKSKIKYLLLFVLGIIIISCTVRAVVQSQLNKEIVYFKRYFEEQKDGIEMYNPLAIKQIPEEVIDELYNVRLQDAAKNPKQEIDWSKYAYVSYATHANYLCNSLMIFDSLMKFGTKAKLVLLLSKELLEPEEYENFEVVNTMLRRLRKIGGDQLIIKHVATITKPTDSTEWSYSLSKLRIFNQTEFERIIYMDNDAILHDKLDELFFIPDYIKFAAPLNYWHLKKKDMQEAYSEVRNYEKSPTNLARYLDRILPRVKKHKIIYNHLPSLPPNLFLDTQNIAQDIIRSEFSFSSMFDHHIMSKSSNLQFASNLMVIKPSEETFMLIQDTLLPAYLNKKEKYDMDLINGDLYNMKKLIRKQFHYFRRIRSHFVPEVLVLPFGRYDLLTGSIKRPDEQIMLKNDILGYKRLDKSGRELPKNIKQIVGDAKYVHFSDYPLLKPWEHPSFDEISCKVSSDSVEEDEMVCEAWNNAYIKYMVDREICYS